MHTRVDQQSPFLTIHVPSQHFKFSTGDRIVFVEFMENKPETETDEIVIE